MTTAVIVWCSDTSAPLMIPDCELDTTKCCVSCGRRGIYRKKTGGVMTSFFACVCGVGFELVERPCGLSSENRLVKAAILHEDTTARASVYMVFDSDLFQVSSSVYMLLRAFGCFVEEFTDASPDAEHRHTILKGSLEIPKERVLEVETSLVCLAKYAQFLGYIDNHVTIRRSVDDSSDVASGYSRGDCNCRGKAA